MGGINLSRVVLGGLLAGLVIDIGEYLLNGVVLGEDMKAAMRRLNLPMIGGGAIAVFLVLGFALGIAAIWLYAAIRPRLGVGVKTALCAAARPCGSSRTCIRTSAWECWDASRGV